MPACIEVDPGTLIGCVSDIEGDADWWSSYVDISKVLQRGADGAILLRDGAHFVFGGDSVDHGPGDLRVLEELGSLKRRYPDRVHLIIGNRDANKLRLPTEMGAAHRAAVPLRTHPGVYWSPSTAPAKVLQAAELDTETEASRLRWLLEHTMSAPRAFECRRAELQKQRKGGEVTDDDVVRSFEHSMKPGGLMLAYLHGASIAVLVGDSLFVHGGPPRTPSSWDPGWTPERSGLPLREWVAELERFTRKAVAQAEEAGAAAPRADAWALTGGYTHPQPGSALAQYGMRDMPGGACQPSVIYNGLIDDDCNPLIPDEATVKWLRDGGVRRVVCGHLPHGDAPLIIRYADRLDAVDIDCCYAGGVTWDGEPHSPTVKAGASGRRGSAVVELLITAHRGARVHGRLGDGTPFEADLEDPVIGRVTDDGWRVKGRSGGRLVLQRNEKWNFQRKLAEEAAVSFAEGPIAKRRRGDPPA